MSARGDGWERWQERVLGELSDLKDEMRRARVDVAALRSEEIAKLQIEVAMLKVKSGLWGAAAGLIPALAVAVYVITR